jgi:hypothetical protein
MCHLVLVYAAFCAFDLTAKYLVFDVMIKVLNLMTTKIRLTCKINR